MPAPVPQAVCDRARLLRTIHNRDTVAEILGISRSTLHHIRRRGYVAAPTTKPFRQRPSDFAIQNRHCSTDELVAHYRTSARCIRRWRRELAG